MVQSSRTLRGLAQWATCVLVLALGAATRPAAVSPDPPGSPALGADSAQYAERLRAMWLGQCIGNWTGLLTEGLRTERPFFTDADWGSRRGRDGARIDLVVPDPCPADDDTDIEYVYLHLMSEAGSPFLSAEQIRDGWRAHINDFIWVSNRKARDLMELGLRPPATGMPPANPYALHIDAQLTTEIFGALAPGMPELALQLAYLPIRTTAYDHAARAAELHVLLYALAATADPRAPRREEIVRIVREARSYLPDSSKASDVVDFVLRGYLAEQSHDDWESVRDAVALRYQERAAENGLTYLGWTESSVNLATGLIALLFGEGDLARTVKIGALSGWDSDNGTATMGGLVGLIWGLDEIRRLAPGRPLPDRYRAHRTRKALPDRLPGDDAAEDTFTGMAERMMRLVATNTRGTP